MTPHLYLGTPFCRGVCGFCNFYKTDMASYRRYFGGGARFADAVRRELDAWGERLPAALETVYVGGGSPLEMPGESLRLILEDLHGRFDLRGAEVTVEANPAWPDDRRVLLSGLVNRISVGIQSFSPEVLRTLHRRHVPDLSFLRALRGMVGNVSLDLLYDVPGQTDAVVRSDLAQALELAPDHLSYYSLEISSENFRKRLPPADPEAWERHRESLESTLAAAGYEAYELSNWAKPGAHSRHNAAYWDCKPYLGVGPAAWGQVVDGGGRALRYLNHRHPGRWRDAVEGAAELSPGMGPSTPEGDAISRATGNATGTTGPPLPPPGSGDRARWEEWESLGPRERANEFIFLSLRKTQGLDLEAFRERFGERFEVKFAPVLGRLAPCFLLEKGHLRLTRRGTLYYNRVCSDLMTV